MELFQQILSIIGAILVLGVFIFVHELGHFSAARKLGFRVVEFAIGFGPRLVKKEKNGTIYSLRVLPIGGMCQFYGEDEDVKDSQSFNAQKIWKRAVVIFAGPLMNILVATLLAFITIFTFGEYGQKKIVNIESGSPAAISGLKVGDIVTGVNGEKSLLISDFSDSIVKTQNNQVMLNVKRGDVSIDILVQNIYNAEKGRNYLGVELEHLRTHYGFMEGIAASFKLVGSMAASLLAFLGSIFTTGFKSGDVVGPVGTISIIGLAVRTSLESVLRLAILIGVNLGIINLVPFPGLDGGRLVLLGIEKIRRKPFQREKEGMLNFIGLMILFALILFITYGDIQNLLG